MGPGALNCGCLIFWNTFPLRNTIHFQIKNLFFPPCWHHNTQMGKGMVSKEKSHCFPKKALTLPQPWCGKQLFEGMAPSTVAKVPCHRLRRWYFSTLRGNVISMGSASEAAFKEWGKGSNLRCDFYIFKNCYSLHELWWSNHQNQIFLGINYQNLGILWNDE